MVLKGDLVSYPCPYYIILFQASDSIQEWEQAHLGYIQEGQMCKGSGMVAYQAIY